jgi:hypothetical protein
MRISKSGNLLDHCALELQLILRAMTDWLGGEDGGPPPKSIRLLLLCWR